MVVVLPTLFYILYYLQGSVIGQLSCSDSPELQEVNAKTQNNVNVKNKNTFFIVSPLKCLLLF